MKLKINDRKLKFGSVSLAITVLTIAAVIIFNAAFTALAYKFSIYTQMSSDLTYSLTDECIDYIKETVIPKIPGGDTVTIYFCNDREIIEADSDLSQILKSAREIEKSFDGRIKIEFLNVYEQPKAARSYGIKAATDVAVVYGDNCHVITKKDFFLWDTVTGEATAYNGEKRFAAALLKVVRNDNPMCYITINHGELVESYELLYMLADAGYNYTYIDLLNFDIPDDCDLLLTFDPRQDLTDKDTVSGISEVEKIENYLTGGGNLWFFASADTFLSGSLDKFESVLEKYGITFAHSENNDGIEECLQIKDPSHSVSVDGYTIFAQSAKNNVADKVLSEVKVQSIFSRATAIIPAGGFEKQSDGSYKSGDGKISLSPLLVSHEGAQAWANGRIVKKATSEELFTLMSLSQAECENGEMTSILACASTAFASEDAMQSTVYGNTTVLSSVSKHTGNDDAPLALVAKPFPTTEMKTLTTKNATIITIISAALPTLAVAAAGAIILTKRKNRV